MVSTCEQSHVKEDQTTEVIAKEKVQGDHDVIGHSVDDPDVWRSIDIDLLDETFECLHLNSELSEGLKQSGFSRPSRLQSRAIPLGRIGQDLLVQSKSGTGKTLVFAVIALDSIDLNNPTCQVLILAPTREIAFQSAQVIKAIGCKMAGLSVQTLIGGLHVKSDLEHLRKCHIAVGTPGRINQLLEQQALATHSLRLLVLDEADKMLDSQLVEQVERILNQLPSSRQTLAVSATFSAELQLFSTKHMTDVITVQAESACIGLAGIHLFKLPTLQDMRFDFEFKVQTTVDILNEISFTQALIFSNFQTRAEHLVAALADKGFRCALISAQLPQKERLKIVKNMKRLALNVIVCTDLLARGFDCEHVNLVLNLDVPWQPETFLHRVGRAGRFGRAGLAITLISNGIDTNRMCDIESTFKLDVRPMVNVSELARSWNRQCDVINEPNLTFETLQNEWIEAECEQSDARFKRYSALIKKHLST